MFDAHPEFEAMTQNLSITTFRYVPRGSAAGGSADGRDEAHLNRLNQALLTRVEKSGEAFLSNAVVDGKFALRACIVNFRTSLVDIEALPPLLSRLGKDVVVSLSWSAVLARLIVPRPSLAYRFWKSDLWMLPMSGHHKLFPPCRISASKKLARLVP